MADPTTPKDPADAPQDPAVSSDENFLHERVFKARKDGAANDAATETSDASAAFGVVPVQLDQTKPLRHIGDSDPPDFQPDNGPRR